MKRVFSLLLALVLMGLLLGASPVTAQQGSPAASEDQLAANKELVRRYFVDALGGNQPQLVEELFSPDFTFHVNGSILTGWQSTMDFITAVKGGFPDGQWAPQDIIAEGDLVGIRTAVSGTNTGSFRGLPATGGSASNVPAMAIFRVADGKLSEAWGEDNFLVVGQQLGSAPAPFGPPVFTDNGQPVGPQTDEATRTANKAVVKRVIDEAWTAGNLAVIDELYAADAINRPTAAAQGTDINAVKTGVNVYRAGIPDLNVATDLMLAEGDEVYSRMTLTGTNTGILFGIPPTNLPIETTGIRIDRLKDGKIVETWIVIDNLRLFQELGLIPAATEATPAA